MSKVKAVFNKIKDFVVKYKFIIPMLFVIIVAVMSIKQNIAKKEKNEHTVTYNEFCKQVEGGDVEEVYLTGGNTFAFKYERKDEIYYSTHPGTATFKEYLLTHDVATPDTVNKEETKQYILAYIPFILLLVVYVAIMLVVYGGGNSFKADDGKPKDDVTFKDIAGLDELKSDLMNIISIMQNKDDYKDTDVKIPRGILLEGEPGNGKTMIARAFANECDMKFIPISASSVGGILAGKGAMDIKAAFKKAKKMSPCIIFFDEIDSLAGRRYDNGGSVGRDDNKTLNALLAEMDGFSQNDDILVLAATNRADTMDPAVLRPGRFDRKFVVPGPDLKARKELLKLNLEGKPVSDDVKTDDLARSFSGLSCASIATIVNEAAIIMIKDKALAITTAMIEDAYTQMVTKGSIKKDKTRTEKEHLAIARHEAGHALVAKIAAGETVERVSILETTSSIGGFTVSNSEEESKLLSINDLENRILVLYAGRAAEYVCNGCDESAVTVGCSNDVTEATKVLITLDKYTASNGLVDYSFIPSNDNVINSKANVEKRSEELWKRVCDIMSNHKNVLDALIDSLLEKEVLYTNDIEEIFERFNLHS